MEEEKIISLFESNDKSNFELGRQLDDSLFGGEVLAGLSKKYGELCRVSKMTIEELLSTDKLFLYNLGLQNLPPIPRCIQELDCSNNSIKEIPPLPYVKIFDCNNNNITNIHSLPSVERLSCCYNELVDLPYMPNVKHLFCYGNRISKIPPLPNLTNLHCQDNNLTSLPNLPKLEILMCRENKVVDVPNYPNIILLKYQ